jgi:hypothetical protein
MAAEVGYKRQRCARGHPSWLFNPYCRDQKTTTTIVILDSSLFHAFMGRNNISPAELLERATANGYEQGAQ